MLAYVGRRAFRQLSHTCHSMTTDQLIAEVAATACSVHTRESQLSIV